MIGGADAARARAVAEAVRDRCDAMVRRTCSGEAALADGVGDGDAVVLDGSPSAGTLRAMADATVARPGLNVLVLGSLEQRTDVLVALSSGALGYLPWDSSPSTVAAGVATLFAGDAVLPRTVSLALLEHLRWGGRGIVVDTPHGGRVELTSREWEVLVLLRQGRTTAEIASALIVSHGTIRTHVAAVLHKLGVDNRRALVGAAG